MHRDYLGSIVAITKKDGAVVEKRFFDAWGNLKAFVNHNNQLITNLQQLQSQSFIIDRGYTGHEHLWKSGLINMNARIYDPILKRFVTPDNVLQNPFNTQNYNKYVYNNPLFYTDPSGNIALPAVMIIAAAVSATTHAIINTINGVPFFYGMGQAMIKGTATAVVTFGIGTVATSIFGTSVSIGKAIFEAGLHGINSGLMSEADGGKFITRFATGSMASLAASGIQALGQSGSKTVMKYDIETKTNFGNRNAGLMKAMVLTAGGLSGGLSATIAGGKFIDGLKQGLLISGPNHLAHEFGELFEEESKIKTALRKLTLNPKDVPDYTITAVMDLTVRDENLKKMYKDADYPKMSLAPNQDVAGRTTNDGITFGKSAFQSYRHLYIAIGHELIHAFHRASKIWDYWIKNYGENVAQFNSERGAYSWIILFDVPSLRYKWEGLFRTKYGHLVN